MYFDIQESENDILKRIARNDESIFTESLQLGLISEQGLSGFYHTPLSVACQTGSFDYVQQLLAIEDVSKNSGCFDNRALQIAADRGDLVLVRRLVELSDIRNNLNDESSSQRHFVYPIENRHWDVVSELLTFATSKSVGALVDKIISGNNGWNFVEVDGAGLAKLLEIYNFKSAVEEYFADGSKKALETLADNQDWKLLTVFLDLRAVFTRAGVNNNYVLETAIRHQQVDLVEKLIALDGVIAGIKADDENIVFLEAVHTGNKIMITKLLEIDDIKIKALNDLGEVLNEASKAQGGSISDWLNNTLAQASSLRLI